MQPIRHLRVLLLGLIVVWSAPTLAQAPITLTGGASSLWAYRLLTAENGTERLVIAYAKATDGPLRIYNLPMRPSSGVIRQSAVRGRNLHVFFRDGSHFRFQPPLDPLAPTPADGSAKNDFPERVLPNKQTPRALCGDEAIDALFAVVTARTAEQIPPPPSTELFDDLINTTGPPPSTADAPSAAVTTAPADTLPDTQPTTTNSANDSADDSADETEDTTSPRFTLVSYRVNHWQPESVIPTFFDDHASCWLAAHDGQVWLLYALPDTPDDLHLTQWDGQAWSTPQKVPAVRPQQLRATGIHDKTLMLVVAAPAGDDTCTVHTQRLANSGQWETGEPLRLDGRDWTLAADRTSFGQLGEHLVGVWREQVEDTEIVHAARWAVAGGDALAAPEKAPVLMARPATLADDRTSMLAATLLLTGLLLVAFMRRRESFLIDLPVPPGFVLARLGKRFLAFVIDLAVITVLTAPPLLIPWMAANNIQYGDDMQAQINYAMMQDRTGIFWRQWVAVSVYVLYGVVFEGIWAATPGKLALGLRVHNHRAERASWGAIVLRNLLRFEVYFPLKFAPVAVLVALTRNRQRLGDLVANTIVVEKA